MSKLQNNDTDNFIIQEKKIVYMHKDYNKSITNPLSNIRKNIHGTKQISQTLNALKWHIHDLAAASNSRKDATETLLDKSMSESSFVIHSSKEHLLCNRMKPFENICHNIEEGKSLTMYF